MTFEISMDPADPSRPYDLEDRTLQFAKAVLAFVRTLPPSIANIELSKQLVRSAGSVGANYIEATESLGNKDFLMKVKISRREAKESRYWLELVCCNPGQVGTQEMLIAESVELVKIFGAIIRNRQA
jgi:four helix bundle protein